MIEPAVDGGLQREARLCGLAKSGKILTVMRSMPILNYAWPDTLFTSVRAMKLTFADVKPGA